MCIGRCSNSSVACLIGDAPFFVLLTFLPRFCRISRAPEKTKVIGYVASGYGKTDEKKVKADIDRYKVRSSKRISGVNA